MNHKNATDANEPTLVREREDGRTVRVHSTDAISQPTAIHTAADSSDASESVPIIVVADNDAESMPIDEYTTIHTAIARALVDSLVCLSVNSQPQMGIAAPAMATLPRPVLQPSDDISTLLPCQPVGDVTSATLPLHSVSDDEEQTVSKVLLDTDSCLPPQQDDSNVVSPYSKAALQSGDGLTNITQSTPNIGDHRRQESGDDDDDDDDGGLEKYSYRRLRLPTPPLPSDCD